MRTITRERNGEKETKELSGPTEPMTRCNSSFHIHTDDFTTICTYVCVCVYNNTQQRVFSHLTLGH